MKYFGTDGIRGKIDRDLTPEFIHKVAESICFLINENFADDVKRSVVIGHDTRASCGWIVDILSGVLAANGIDSINAGIVPTAALSFLTRQLGAAVGIMITASHNDCTYNGIKLFSSSGEKLEDEDVEVIERIISSLSSEDFKEKASAASMMARTEKSASPERNCVLWENYLVEKFTKLKKWKKKTHISVDCAFGSGCEAARNVLTRLGFSVTLHNDRYDGMNINSGKKCKADFAFDGDADRCVVFAEDGKQIHGDALIYLLADYLNVKRVVATSMFNYGVEKQLNKRGITLIRTAVGDRFVAEELKKQGLMFGGETSGHIIFSDIWCVGDGLLTALMVLSMMAETDKKLSELASGVNVCPSVTKSIPVNPLQKEYKILIRPSGTEDLMRITVEGPNECACERLADEILFAISNNA